MGIKFNKEFLNSIKALADNKVAVFTEVAPNLGLRPPKECFGCHPDKVDSIHEVVEVEGTRYYVVDWKLRGDGFLPLRSFISEADLKS